MPTANQLDPMEVIRPAANGLVALAVVSAMSSSFGAMGMAAGMGGFSSPYEELENLDKRISRLSYRLDIQRESVKGTRIHKAKLMQEYGLGVLPSIVEMRKYPKLRTTDYYLAKAEKDLDRMEISLLNLQRRRKELQTKLGMRKEEEGEKRRIYTAMKKYEPPTERGY